MVTVDRPKYGPRSLKVAAVAICCALSPAAVDADVIELKTGQRVEGTLKQATSKSVSVEVGGQTITFDSEKVRAIYFGAAPPATSSGTPSAPDQALRAIKALRAVTQAGVSYRDYGPRVADAKIQVEEHLPAFKQAAPAAAAALDRAMTYYALGGSAWEASLGRDTEANKSAMVSVVLWEGRDCPTVFEVIKKHWANAYGEVLRQAVPAVWSCASEKITEAEKLFAGEKK